MEHRRYPELPNSTRQLDYRFGLADAFGEADGASGGVVVTEAVGAALAPRTGAPGAGTAGAFGFTGAGDAAGC